MGIFNQFSFVLLSGVMGVMAAALLWRLKRLPRALRMGVFVAYLLVVLFVFTRRHYATNDATSVAAVEKAINAGQPTLVVLYSNY